MYKVEYEVGKGTRYARFPVSMITSATRAEEIKRQVKVKRNVARESLLNEERKLDTYVKKDNFEENDELVVNGKILTNTHKNDQKKSAAKYNKTKNNMVKKKKEDKQEPLSSYLQNQLEKRNLKIVDVRGDGNCFFRAITHQLCYNESHHEQTRQPVVKEVIENSEKYKNFITEGLDEYVSSLSTNRERANNTAVQATANALGISIEIINDSERIPSYTVIPCEVESNVRHQHVVLGYISNIHYVTTEFQE